MRLGVYGGAFDPPHAGHLTIAEGVLKACELDRILFIPYTTGPHRPAGPVASTDHRLEMLRLCLAGRPAFEPDDREIRRGGTSYMIDTLRSLLAEQPEATLYLIVGSDQLKIFRDWREWRRILELAVVAVIERPGHALSDGPEELRDRMVTVPIPPQTLSSTRVRELIAEGGDIRPLVPGSVLRYIQEHGLYGYLRPEPPES
jgi:nicotinate-nucleotide adenylyltransferase